MIVAMGTEIKIDLTVEDYLREIGAQTMFMSRLRGENKALHELVTRLNAIIAEKDREIASLKGEGVPVG